MVDWDRVEELHRKGQSWEQIAADPKVGFHPDQSVSQAGSALRRLYYRRKSRAQRQPQEGPKPKHIDASGERRWSLARIGYLLTPILAIWFVLAYLYPSPLGLILPAIPWIAFGLAVVVFLLAFGLLRATRRWTKVYRTTLVIGIILGLVFVGLVSLTAVLNGCPILPSAASLRSEPGGWRATPSSVAPWQSNGQPVVFSYGATWCPYCSASSWPLWKALTEFSTNFAGGINGMPGTEFMYSNPSDVYPNTPEVVFSNMQVSSPVIATQLLDYYWTPSSGTAGAVTGTSNCVQQAYVVAYSGGGVPFFVLNGQYIASSLINPGTLTGWAGSGVQTVAQQVLSESGSAWNSTSINSQTAWICAFLLKSAGYPSVSAFLSAYPALHNPASPKYQWTTSLVSQVGTDMGLIT